MRDEEMRVDAACLAQTEIRIVHVDEAGRDSNGDDFTVQATPWAIVNGLMRTEPVILLYPDGNAYLAAEAMFTEKGMDKLREELAPELD